MVTIKSFGVNYFSKNTYLLYDDTKEVALIDCGCLHKEGQKEVSDFIAQNGLTLKRHLCTYPRLDHTLGNEFVHNTYGLSLEVHRANAEGPPSPERQAKAFGPLVKVKGASVGKYLVSGETIKFGKSELAVLSVPGHSPGGVTFCNKKNDFVIVGDSLFARSTGRTDLWGGNQNILFAAIKGKLLPLPDETVVYPGHGPETRIIDEKLNNSYL